MEAKRKLNCSLLYGQSEDGLTLIEMLVVLNVMMGCILFFSLALSQINSVRASINDDRQIEWHLFLNQMEYELRDKVLVNVTSTAINVKQIKDGMVQNDSISYNLFNNMYRRTVNRSGHQPMLTKLKTVKVQQENNQITFDVTFENDESYTARFKVEVLNE